MIPHHFELDSASYNNNGVVSRWNNRIRRERWRVLLDGNGSSGSDGDQR